MNNYKLNKDEQLNSKLLSEHAEEKNCGIFVKYQLRKPTLKKNFEMLNPTKIYIKIKS